MILGLIFIFFIPGYSMSLALFPTKLNRIERFAFSGALSIMGGTLAMLVLNMISHVEISALNVFLFLSILTSLCLAVWRVRVVVRRSKDENR